jgi:hypothetical protein
MAVVAPGCLEIGVQGQWMMIIEKSKKEEEGGVLFSKSGETQPKLRFAQLC